MKMRLRRLNIKGDAEPWQKPWLFWFVRCLFGNPHRDLTRWADGGDEDEFERIRDMGKWRDIVDKAESASNWACRFALGCEFMLILSAILVSSDLANLNGYIKVTLICALTVGAMAFDAIKSKTRRTAKVMF